MRLSCIVGDGRHALASPRAGRRSWFAAAPVVAVALLLGAASPTIAQTAADASRASSPSRSTAHPYAAHVAEASQRFGIPEAWIWAVMRVESAGNASATSHAGAMGLMQVMPGTYAELRVRYGLATNAYDPRDNILAGTAYLREMHDRYGSAGFLAAYNAGPGRWEDYARRGRPLPAETVAYMARLGAIGGGDAALPPPAIHAVRAPVDRLAWTRAALFVGISTTASPQTIDRSTAALPPIDGTTDADPLSDTRSDNSDALDAAPASIDPLFAIRRPQ